MFLLNEEDRPRERLLKLGPSALSNVELLAVLLRTGTKEMSVMTFSKMILNKLSHIKELSVSTIQELMTIKGVKMAKAATLIAAVELGRRLSSETIQIRDKISSSKDIYNYLWIRTKDLQQEHFYCLYLDTKSNLIKAETIFIGTINQTVIHPREIFKQAIKLSASSIVFAHNHPTGDPMPSAADTHATKELIHAGELLGIHVLDHIIMGNHCYYSFMDRKKHIMI